MDEAFEAVTGNSIWGLALAGVAGAAILGRKQLKPLAKTAIKGYFSGREWVTERFAETGERLQDLYAEAKYEYRSELSADESGEAEAVEAAEAAEAAEAPTTRRSRSAPAPAAEAAASA